MNRPRLTRGLRIAWTAFFGLVCLLLGALWVRSLSRFDRVSVGRQKAIASDGGRLMINEVFNLNRERPQLPVSTEWFQLAGVSFSIWTAPRGALIPVNVGRAIPLWQPIAVAAALTAAPWMRLRFSLRTLLIATTLIAVALGLLQII